MSQNEDSQHARDEDDVKLTSDDNVKRDDKQAKTLKWSAVIKLSVLFIACAFVFGIVVTNFKFTDQAGSSAKGFSVNDTLNEIKGLLIGNGDVENIQDDKSDKPSAVDDSEKTTEPDGETWTRWYEDEAPQYYRIIGKATQDFSIEAGKIHYGGLDSLGRTTRVVGCITYDMIARAKGHRHPFEKGSDPSGWGHNRKSLIKLPNGRVYRGYFWNRSHLIADSLGGKAARENVITGTRMQNVGANNGKGGMAYCESLTRDFLRKHTDCVMYYSATPVYHGDELVPRSIIVDMKSCTGEINQRVEVYNAAKGYEIDYKTGDFAPAAE